MSMDHRAIAARYATAFTVLGLLLGLVIVFVMGVAVLVTMFPLSIALGALAALIVARKTGSALAWRIASSSSARAMLLGIVVAGAALELGVVVGCLPHLLGDKWTAGIGEAISDYVVKPVYWVSLFGLLPVLLLGSVYGLFLRGILRRELPVSGTI